ncbi:unnamed protein product [Sphagnum jensenii]|uniref:Uncharacterized protein n=1 Tax=Sphagnum jensenii TaxID=128206 RepID=A0ABP0X8Q5_9BRYO
MGNMKTKNAMRYMETKNLESVKPIEPTMEPTASTSRVMDTDISSSVVSRMVTSVLGSPTFSANDLMASGVDLTRVFQLAATFPWQAAAAKMDALPIRPAIDRERLTPGQLVEPNADERERVMGFPTGMTFVPSISEASHRQVLGQAMDLNCLTWIVSLGMAEQHRLRATFVIVTLLVSSLPTVTVEASTGGEESYTFHPWSTWDVLGEHVKVVAHAIGGVCCSSGVPLGDLKERVASPKVFA